MRLEKIKQYLKANDIRPLDKRVRILEYLIKKRNHPTVDMIYTDLVRDVPTLSKTTVYNVLKLFVEKGVAISLSIEGNEVRYDADTCMHGHFKCSSCGGVFDFGIKDSEKSFPGLENFLVQEFHVYIKGICSFCRTKNLS